MWSGGSTLELLPRAFALMLVALPRCLGNYSEPFQFPDLVWVVQDFSQRFPAGVNSPTEWLLKLVAGHRQGREGRADEASNDLKSIFRVSPIVSPTRTARNQHWGTTITLGLGQCLYAMWSRVYSEGVQGIGAGPSSLSHDPRPGRTLRPWCPLPLRRVHSLSGAIPSSLRP